MVRFSKSFLKTPLVMLILIVTLLVNTTQVESSTNKKSASTIDQHLGGLLKGKGNSFVIAGNKYKVDAYLLASIAMHETGNGTSKALRERNNVGGYMKKGGGLQNFSSIDASIEYGAELLSRPLYIGGGKDTLIKIRNTYAPIGAGNDPNGLNQNWVNGVTKNYTAMTGKAPGRFTLDWNGEVDGSGSVPLDGESGESILTDSNSVELEQKYKEYLGVTDDSLGVGAEGDLGEIDSHLSYGAYKVTKFIIKTVRNLTMVFTLISTVVLVNTVTSVALYYSGVPFAERVLTVISRGKISVSDEDFLGDTVRMVTVNILVLGVLMAGLVETILTKVILFIVSLT